VILGTTNVYYIWYGNWANNASAVAILSDLASNIGGSPYFNINTTYSDGVPNLVSNSVRFVASTTDNYSRGTALNDSDIQTIVSSAISSARLPLDTNGVYFVLTSADVNETTGFCTNYCGWHTYGVISGSNIKYSFVGNPDRCPAACAFQATGPNGNAGADGMASIIAHELEETATDPLLNAWYDSNGQENADKCAWTFGTTYTVGGAQANMKLGPRDYLIQQNWVNASGGYCALSFGTPAPNFSLSASPASQTVVQGAGTSYTATVTPSNGFTGTVTFSVGGLPAGASASFNPTSVTTSGSTTMSVTTSSTTPAGSYPLTITGTSGLLSHTASVTLVVNAATTPNFSLSATPASQTVVQGASTSYTVNITRTGGFNGSVALSVSGLPSGAAGTFSPNPAPGASSALSVTTSTTTPAGTYPLTITGVSGTTHTTSVTLVVTAAGAGDFSLSVTPTSRTIAASASTTYTVNITRTGGFTGSVTLSVTGLPTGASASFSPNPAAGASSTLTITTLSSTPTGTFALTIKGVSGALTHTTSATLVMTGCDGNCP
jgi:hypothetical protein